MNTRKVGTEYENRATIYLEKLGYQILERNYRCRIGEIDLIAGHEGYLVFVEVKYRSNAAQGYALEAVNGRKQATIRRVARHYLMSHHLPEDTPCRFDAVGITGDEIALVKDGF